MKGLEPPRREAPDPKSGAAANYATSAACIQLDCKDIFLNRITRIFFQVLTIFNANSAILLILCFSCVEINMNIAASTVDNKFSIPEILVLNLLNFYF
jgi:hypothetical protein